MHKNILFSAHTNNFNHTHSCETIEISKNGRFYSERGLGIFKKQLETIDGRSSYKSERSENIRNTRMLYSYDSSTSTWRVRTLAFRFCNLYFMSHI